jgi:aromatic ring-cleaving dioxygenase
MRIILIIIKTQIRRREILEMLHIHVYFTAEEKDTALELRQFIEDSFPALKLGRVHDKPVGPHPKGSFLIEVPEKYLDFMVEVMMQHNMGLSILIHRETGNDLVDHSPENTIWINEELELDTSIFEPHTPPPSGPGNTPPPAPAP